MCVRSRGACLGLVGCFAGALDRRHAQVQGWTCRRSQELGQEVGTIKMSATRGTRKLNASSRTMRG